MEIIIFLDFFKEINGFVKEGEANQAREYQEYGHHGILFIQSFQLIKPKAMILIITYSDAQLHQLIANIYTMRATNHSIHCLIEG